MKLYLLRHGTAVDIGQKRVTSDAGRMLTREGRRDTRTILRAVRPVCRPDCIVTSPLVRARETAEIAHACLPGKPPLLLLDHLEPGGDMSGIVTWLRARREAAIMLVGHMPALGILASALVFGEKKERIILKKSGVCCIEFEAGLGTGKGRLAWLVSPVLIAGME